MSDHVEEIKQRLDLVELLNEYLKLEKAGINYKGRCPFHNEKTPSFFVSPERGTWKCFGCGLGGDHFTFIEQIEGVDFKEALQVLARRAGVTIRYRGQTQSGQNSNMKARLRELHTQAVRYYQVALKKTKGGKLAQGYLKNRKMKAATIEAWSVGYAPSAWRALANHLHGKGFTVDELVASGLVIKSDKKPPAGELPVYDRFRARIMFPISNISGQVVGFTGRILPQAEDEERPVGKYVNSPQTALFDKSSLVFGLDKARLSIREHKATLLVEGQMDVIMAHQAGSTNAVAVSGTALTPQHLKILKRYAESLIMAFDRDDAGEAAAKKSIYMALDAGFGVSALMIPKDADPADVIGKSEEQWKKLVEGRLEIMEYFFAQASENYDVSSIEGKKNFSAYLFEPIAAIANRIEQAALLQRMAQSLSVAENDVRAEFNAYLKNRRAPLAARPVEQPIAPPIKPKDSRQNAEETLFAIGIKYPKLFKTSKKEITQLQLHNEQLSAILKAIQDPKRTPKDLGEYLHKQDQQLHILYNELAMRADIYFSSSEAVEDELERLLSYLKRLDHKDSAEAIRIQLQHAESQGDSKLVAKLVKELAALSS